MVTCQSSELGCEVTVELLADFLSLGRGSVNCPISSSVREMMVENANVVGQNRPPNDA